MKFRTYCKLMKFVKESDFNEGFVMQSLFKKYNQIEEFDLDNMAEYINDFFNFALKSRIQKKIIKNIKTINYQTYEIKDELDDIEYALSAFYDESNKIKNHAFVDIVKLCTKSGKRVLDVGAGGIPYSSILLAQKGYIAHSMDRILLSDKTMTNYGVIPHNEQFMQGTDISEFDIVVGRRPCDAIKAIAVNCSKRYKPFIMELCYCSFHKETKQNGKRYLGWDEVFYDINPKIEVYNGFAYYFGDGKDSYVENAIDYCIDNAKMQCAFIDFDEAVASIFSEISKRLSSSSFLFSDGEIFINMGQADLFIEEDDDDDDDCLGG